MVLTKEGCPFNVTPFDQSRLIKNPNLVNINYTNQDFWSMKARLEQFIKERFEEDFTDFVESDLAAMLIENWAFVADTLSFKIDQIANEIFIDTVSEIDNAFRLSLLVGFKPQPPIAARALFSAIINQPLETDLLIATPIIHTITTETGARTYELFASNNNNEPMFDEPIIISAGTFLTTSVVGLEGQTTNSIEKGSGEINQIVTLTGPVISNSVTVTVDGVEWAEVDFFTDSQPRREFRVDFDPNYNAFVIFGNNRAGLIPSNGSEIIVTFRVGGGVEGNIVTGSVTLQRGVSVPGFEFLVQVVFRNYTRGEFGYAGDDLATIKRNLPRFLRMQDRAVTGDDYKSLADMFVTDFNGQVGKSTAILRMFGCAANVVDLYVLARDGENDLQEAGNGLKVQLGELIEEKKMITDKVCIKNGVVVETDIFVDVIMDKFYRKFEPEFEERILRRINSFFDLNNWDYNQDLKSVDLIKELSDIKELRSIDATFITTDENNSGEVVTSNFFEIIRPGDTTLNFIFE